MKLTTNIVLTGDNGRTNPYMIQLIPEEETTMYKFVHQQDETWSNEHTMFFDSTLENVLSKKGNEWYEEEDLEGQTYEIKKSKIRLYFPQYSADTFLNKCIYILNLFIFIAGKEVELGCFKFQRKDALACSPKRFDGMDEYIEYMDFEIPSPQEIYYNKNIDLPKSIKDHNIIDNAARLYVSLHIVDQYGSKYIKKDGWTGAQNNINLADYNGLHLNMLYENLSNKLIMNLLFNTDCGNSIKEYIENIYNFKVTEKIRWELVVMDEEDIYYQWYVVTEGTSDLIVSDFNDDYNDDFDSSRYSNRLTIDFNDLYIDDFNNFFGTWNTWKSGLFLVGSVAVGASKNYFSSFDESFDDSYGPLEIDDLPIVKIFSNKVPLTKELFSKMLKHDNFPSKINLNEIDMNNITINAINSIEKNVQTITYKTESQKNHMIQPVFYQTREMNGIVIHPAVTENISLNLETYKPYVKRFLLQIEGISFKEIGRTSQGIVFKIMGNMLPKSVNEGTAYVLDQDMNLVTSGKYKYEF